MPRKPRELVDSAIYHVFNRGNDRRNLFSEPEDYHCFLVLGTKDPLVTPNPYYAQMGKTEEERRKRYREFLSFDEPYAQMLDASLAKV